MRDHQQIKSSLIYKVSEKAIPVLVWITILMPVWLSPFHPAIAAYLILGYLIYFLYKAFKMSYYGLISYRLMKMAESTDWQKRASHEQQSSDIHHFAMIVIATESETKVQKTLEYLRDQKYDSSKLTVILAMEDRIEGSHEKGALLVEMFKKDFQHIEAVYHVLEDGEVIGKASNATYASKRISSMVRERKLDPKNVLITVCDADSLLPDQYLSYLTYKYIHEENREFKFFAAPVLLYNNFWKLPFPVRMQMTLSSVARLSFLSQRDDLIQISTYSMSLWLLEEVGYWDVDIIPEDWHIWMQAFYTLGEHVKTVPLYLPIVRDGVLRPTYFKTLKMRYDQEKRWAWGVTDVPYSITRFFYSPHINFWIKLRRLLYVAENHFMWPTAFFLLTISASIPGLMNKSFEQTVLGYLLPELASFILSSASFMLLLAVFFDYQLRKRINIETSWTQVPLLFVQWYLLPIVSFVFSALPALDAHTHMLLGKNLEYKTTKKVG